MADMFISYSRKDIEFGQRLHTNLVEGKRDIWIDWNNIPLAAEWWDKICEGILASDNVVVIISPSSLASPICNLEIEHAIKLNKRIVPILYQNTNEQKAYAELITVVLNDFQRALLKDRDLLTIARDNWRVLSGLNWINFTDEAKFQEKLQALLQAVDTDLDYVDEHTRLLVRAADWASMKHNLSLLLQGDDLTMAMKWLENAKDKLPQPAPLQQQYILKSLHIAQEREREEARIRRLIRRLRIAQIVLLVLALTASLAAGGAYLLYKEAQFQFQVAAALQERAIASNLLIIHDFAAARDRYRNACQMLEPDESRWERLSEQPYVDAGLNVAAWFNDWGLPAHSFESTPVRLTHSRRLSTLARIIPIPISISPMFSVRIGSYQKLATRWIRFRVERSVMQPSLTGSLVQLSMTTAIMMKPSMRCLSGYRYSSQRLTSLKSKEASWQ